MQTALEARALAVFALMFEREPSRTIPAHQTQPCACAAGEDGNSIYADRDGSVQVLTRATSISMRINHLPAVARICERYPLPGE